MSEKDVKPIISKNKLLEAGVYFGHNTSLWNPKMKPYIHMKRKNIHIIDLIKTTLSLKFTYDLIKKYVERKASFIFVGTKRIAKETIKYNAQRTNSFYVSERWLGGTLTNHHTIQKRVATLINLEAKAANNYDGYTKKEGAVFEKQLQQLTRNLSGIRDMKFKPHVMIVADPMHDIIAVKEARKMKMKIIGITDTNTDPSLVDVPIPANDDSIKSVTLIMTILADAIADVKGGNIEYAFKDDDEIELPTDPEKEAKMKLRNEWLANRKLRYKKDYSRPQDKDYSRPQDKDYSRPQDGRFNSFRDKNTNNRVYSTDNKNTNNRVYSTDNKNTLYKMTKAEIIDKLIKNNIKYDPTSLKAELIEILNKNKGE